MFLLFSKDTDLINTNHLHFLKILKVMTDGFTSHCRVCISGITQISHRLFHPWFLIVTNNSAAPSFQFAPPVSSFSAPSLPINSTLDLLSWSWFEAMATMQTDALRGKINPYQYIKAWNNCLAFTCVLKFFFNRDKNFLLASCPFAKWTLTRLLLSCSKVVFIKWKNN